MSMANSEFIVSTARVEQGLTCQCTRCKRPGHLLAAMVYQLYMLFHNVGAAFCTGDRKRSATLNKLIIKCSLPQNNTNPCVKVIAIVTAIAHSRFLPLRVLIGNSLENLLAYFQSRFHIITVLV